MNKFVETISLMGFSQKLKQTILVQSARHCCVCHRGRGINIEVHHIKPQQQGGTDTTDNAIALCFDCHADAGHYFAGHPKGLRLSPEELLQHKIEWFKIVKEHRIQEPKNNNVELFASNKNFKGLFKPEFVKEVTKYTDRNLLKKVYELTRTNPMDFVNELKEKNKQYKLYSDPQLNRVNNYDEFLDYLSGNHLKSDNDESEVVCQPIKHQIGAFRFYKAINKSVCVLDLKFVNHGPEVLEDYKLYLDFENIIEANFVSKRVSALDTNKYNYNVMFFEKAKGEFIPERTVLVQNDSVLLDPICFIPNPKIKTVTLKWTLLARNIYQRGELEFVIQPKYEKSEKTKFVDVSEIKRTTLKVIPKIIIE